MANTIPPWLLGKHVTTVSATPLTVAVDGTYTTGSASTLIGRCDEITFSSRNATENISPMDDRQTNEVIVESATSLTLVEILQSNPIAASNLLAQIAYGYDYNLFTIARAGKTFSFIGVVGDYTESLRKGKSTGTLNVQMVSVSSGINGTTPPAYYANPSYS